jgi:hypothetical protein
MSASLQEILNLQNNPRRFIGALRWRRASQKLRGRPACARVEAIGIAADNHFNTSRLDSGEILTQLNRL